MPIGPWGVTRIPTSRVYLDVPFSQKNNAKKHGARWDSSKRSWYVEFTNRYNGSRALPSRELSPSIEAISAVEIWGDILDLSNIGYGFMPSVAIACVAYKNSCLAPAEREAKVQKWIRRKPRYFHANGDHI